MRTVMEGSVKRRVTAYLLDLQRTKHVPCFFTMPVSSGYGRSLLDYEGCICGYYFAIETKSPDPDADLTPRQRQIAKQIIAGGGKVFIISGDDGILAFKHWVGQCRTSYMTNSFHLPDAKGKILETRPHI